MTFSLLLFSFFRVVYFVVNKCTRTHTLAHTCEGYVSCFMLFSISDDFIIVGVCARVCVALTLTKNNMLTDICSSIYEFASESFCFALCFLCYFYFRIVHVCCAAARRARARVYMCERACTIRYINLNLTFFSDAIQAKNNKLPMALPLAGRDKVIISK